MSTSDLLWQIVLVIALAGNALLTLLKIMRPRRGRERRAVRRSAARTRVRIIFRDQSLTVGDASHGRTSSSVATGANGNVRRAG
jgi:hypothetical protein